MRNLTRQIITAFAVIGLAVAIGGGAQAADRVNVGLGGSLVNIPLYIAHDKGLFAAENIDANLMVFVAGASEMAPLSRGELDVASGGTSVSLFNAIARGLKLRIVADLGHTGPDDGYLKVMVRKDLIEGGGFKSLKDLKGKNVGMAAPGIGQLTLLNAAAEAGGLSFDDIHTVYLPMPMQIAGLKNRVLDATILPEPQVTILTHDGLAVPFMSTEKLLPGYEISMVFYGEKFLNEKPELALRFMRAYLRAVRVYKDAVQDGRLTGPGSADIIDIMARNFKMQPSLIAAMHVPDIDPDGMVRVESLQKDIDFFNSRKMLTGSIDLHAIVDMSFAQKASAELGPYKSK